MSGVYVFYNEAIRDPLPPYGMLMKIGRGIIEHRFRSAQKSEGTYLPTPYEIACAKTCDDDVFWERHLHDKFKSHRYTPINGSGLGTEWFRNLTVKELRVAMEDVPGNWYNLPAIKHTNEIILKQCIEMGIQDSQQYIAERGDELPCERVGMYDFLHPNSQKISMDDFGRIVFQEGGIRSTDEYDRFAKTRALPSLIQIEDGYFGNTGFRDMKERYAPTRGR